MRSAFRWGLQRVRRVFRPRGVVLLYHVVGAEEPDPWRLQVTPGHFAEHMAVLRRHARPLGLQQLVQAARAGRVPPGAVAVTFDDGYASTLVTAKPLLARHEIPATVFVTTGAERAGSEFWWDALAQVLLLPDELPAVLRLHNRSTDAAWQLGDAAHFTSGTRHSDCLRRRAPSARLAFCHELNAWLQRVPGDVQSEALGRIAAWAGVSPRVRESWRPLAPEEIRRLAGDGLVDVGAHTVNHVALPALPAGEQQREIEASRARLQELLGRQVSAFAYPFGLYDAATLNVVRRAGFALACTVAPQSVAPGCDPLLVPRFSVPDCDGETFARRLCRWFGS